MSERIEGSAAQHASEASADASGRVTSAQLRDRVAEAARHAGTELAVVDVRETLTFSDEHLIFSTNLALNRLELEAPARLPRRDVPIVLVDADGTLTGLAAKRFHRLGYTDVAILDGGVARWKQDGFPVYAGFNVRSKAFAEVIEHSAATPALDFPELNHLPGGTPVVLDSRTRDEYRNATAPNAIHAPGADLVRVVRDLVPSPTTPIVVVCGGRTRSIIGAQSLIDAGVPNPVYSLRNGTGGLRLAGHPRDLGADRFAPAPSAAALDWATTAAKRFNPDVPVLDSKAIAAWRQDVHRTVYFIDLRDPSASDVTAFDAARFVPGGQVVQEIDVHAAVIGARVVLIDDADLVRATMTASWLTRLGGFDVAIAPASAVSAAVAAANANRSAHRPNADSSAFNVPGNAGVRPIDLAAEQRASANGGNGGSGSNAASAALIIDLSRSPAFRSAHLPGAVWSTRDTWQQTWRESGEAQRVVLTSDDGRLAALAWQEWAATQWADDHIAPPSVRVLVGGNRAWREADLPLEAVPAGSAADRVYPDIWVGPQQRGGDVLPHVRAYLDWEVDLLRQVEHDPDFHALLQLH